ncbi:MAG: hypothetical protein ABJI96_03075 [Paracoccaceae bacterium]
MSRKKKPFFVGYLPIPKGLRSYLLGIVALFIASFAITGLVIGATQDDPGDGAFRFDYGRQTVTGVVELTPYPVLRVTEGNERLETGHTIMLSASGKNNVDDRAKPLEGKLAKVSGIVLQRGDLDMLQLRGGRQGIAAADGEAPEVLTEPLGRWKIAGEICDGKCLAGAMRPGRGLAHKACANLCLIGGVPPVFVSTQPIEGSEFLLITGPDGGELPKSAYDYVAQYVSLEGDVERRGDLLVLRMDPATLEVLE